MNKLEAGNHDVKFTSHLHSLVEYEFYSVDNIRRIFKTF